MNNQPYLIPDGNLVVFKEEIKKNLFLTHLQRSDSVASAKQFILQIREKHPNARHHCWAFVAGRSEDSMKWGFSDDGEPSGTAGKPMLAQLTGSGIGQIVAVVTRYSSGIKLGTGGLVKAYGGGVQEALKLVVTKEQRITEKIIVHCDYNLVSLVDTLAKEWKAIQTGIHYAEEVVIELEVESRFIDDFKRALINRSSAKIKF